MPAPLPFDGSAIRRLRAQLGLGHDHIAHAMRMAYGTVVDPRTVAAWERGEAAPTTAELPALAAALWCAPGELMSAPRTLLEHRLARGLAAADLARAVGMTAERYARMEADGQWAGNVRQTAALAEALGLGAPALLEVTGGEPRLAELLRQALTTRWQPYVRPVAGLVAVDRERVARALRRLHADYQAAALPSLSWADTGRSARAADRAAPEFLATAVQRFWPALR